jgi:serine/threonine protein kinase
MSAHQYISAQRVAGYDVKKIVHLACGIVDRVQALHASGLVHMDLKLRNVLLHARRNDPDSDHPDDIQLKVVLCDLDAAKKISERLHHRRESEEKMGSSAYWPSLLTSSVRRAPWTCGRSA